ncbi:DUF975 family protein [Streptococcus halichoeri]|uniref:DUF975 family protein n=1 Tax=Streptococcus halichoeri TaxID=254785 RepID=UPI00135A4713|nr:DUF975 family protein [Streptococcus halichoeri]
MTIKAIKQNAKETLKHLPGKFILFLAPILLGLFSFTIQVHQNYLVEQNFSISAGVSYFPILLRVLTFYLTYSATFTMLEVIRKRKTTIHHGDNIIALTRPYVWHLLALEVVKFLLLAVWSLLLMVGLTLVLFGIYPLLYGKNFEGLAYDANSLLIAGIILSLIGLGVRIIKELSYSMSEYLFYDQIRTSHYQSPLAVIQASKSLMKGHKWRFFLFQLSFIGWFVLVFLSFGILYFYVLPYYLTSTAIFYQNLLEESRAAS